MEDSAVSIKSPGKGNKGNGGSDLLPLHLAILHEVTSVCKNVGE